MRSFFDPHGLFSNSYIAEILRGGFPFCHRGFVAERFGRFAETLRIKHLPGPIEDRVVEMQAQAVIGSSDSFSSAVKIDAKCEMRESILAVKTLLLLIALMCNASAFARLGETTAQIDKRYGQPLETIRNNGESRRYSFREFTVLVGFERGISECEVYQKKDNSRMTQAEIQGLLQVNAGSSEWRYEPEENTDNYVYWSRDRRARVAIYTLATHGLMVTSKAFLPRFAHLINSSDRTKMQGF